MVQVVEETILAVPHPVQDMLSAGVGRLHELPGVRVIRRPAQRCQPLGVAVLVGRKIYPLAGREGCVVPGVVREAGEVPEGGLVFLARAAVISAYGSRSSPLRWAASIRRKLSLKLGRTTLISASSGCTNMVWYSAHRAKCP